MSIRAIDEPLSASGRRGSRRTSSQSERFFERDGRRYGHIFDPRRAVQSVGSAQRDGDTSQGSPETHLSTALFVMGASEGKCMIARKPGVSAFSLNKARTGS
jgi:thiamine biosynthesis lipoprotein